MLEFTLKRLATLVVMMVAMSVLTFVIIQAPPGSYIDAYIMQESANNQGLTFDRDVGYFARKPRMVHGMAKTRD